MPKHILKSNILGELGVNFIERVVLQMGHLWYPTPGLEAGIDGRIELCNPETREALNTIILVQSKATAVAFQGETATSLDYLCTVDDLAYWLQGNAPVILVVSRPYTEEAYWVSLKDYFRDPAARRSRKVRFDKQRDRFDVSCTPALMALAMPRHLAPYLAPVPRTEQIQSNLLPISSLAARLYLAETQYRHPGEVWSALRRVIDDPHGGWVLTEGRILTFHNLNHLPWTAICEQGTLEDFPVAEWSDTEDVERSRLFVQLLNRALRDALEPDVKWDKNLDIYYIRATPDLASRRYTYATSSGSPTSRTVFQGYRRRRSSIGTIDEGDETEGQADWYKHSAFAGQFRRLGGAWYLEVTPTYHFTKDGFSSFPYAADRLTGIKRLERNDAVRGQLMMWAAYLIHEAPSGSDSAFRLDEPLTFTLNAGLDDDAWRISDSSEPDASDEGDNRQPRLFEP